MQIPFFPTTETKNHHRDNPDLPTAVLPDDKVDRRLTLLSLTVRVCDEVLIPASSGAEAEELIAREVYFRNVESDGLDLVVSFPKRLQALCHVHWFRSMRFPLAEWFAH